MVLSSVECGLEALEVRARHVRDLIAGSIPFDYDPDNLATKITTQLVHESNSKTRV